MAHLLNLLALCITHDWWWGCQRRTSPLCEIEKHTRNTKVFIPESEGVPEHHSHPVCHKAHFLPTLLIPRNLQNKSLCLFENSFQSNFSTCLKQCCYSPQLQLWPGACWQLCSCPCQILVLLQYGKGRCCGLLCAKKDNWDHLASLKIHKIQFISYSESWKLSNCSAHNFWGSCWQHLLSWKIGHF